MAKYKLINNGTHRIWYTNNEKVKAKLLEEGYHIDTGKVKTTKKRKVAGTNGRKENKNNPKSDI